MRETYKFHVKIKNNHENKIDRKFKNIENVSANLGRFGHDLGTLSDNFQTKSGNSKKNKRPKMKTIS